MRTKHTILALLAGLLAANAALATQPADSFDKDPLVALERRVRVLESQLQETTDTADRALRKVEYLDGDLEAVENLAAGNRGRLDYIEDWIYNQHGPKLSARGQSSEIEASARMSTDLDLRWRGFWPVDPGELELVIYLLESNCYDMDTAKVTESVRRPGAFLIVARMDETGTGPECGDRHQSQFLPNLRAHLEGK